jgi:hypothetical protein
MLTPLAALLGTEFFTIITTTGGTIDFAQKIIDFIGFAKDINTDVTKILNAELNTGLHNLEYAKNTNSFVDSIGYINNAIQNFTAALSQEKSERLVCAYLGLIFCFYLKGDVENCKIKLKEFSKENIDLLPDYSKLNEVVKVSKITFRVRENIVAKYKIFKLTGFSSPQRIKKREKDEKYLEEMIKIFTEFDENYFLIPLYERQLEIVKLQNQARKQIEDYEKDTFASDIETILINYRQKLGTV